MVPSALTPDTTETAIDNYLNAVAQSEDGAYDGSLWSFDTTGQTYTLTTGTDAGAAFTGGDSDDTFQADVEGTALLPLQTLNNSDDLDGGGGWNTLNAQLVDPSVVPAGLTNIQEINISAPPGIVGFFLSDVRLDLVNANDVQVLGLNGYIEAGILINNLQTALTEVNISNSSFVDFDINHIGAPLGGENDELDINLVNAWIELDIDYEGSEDDQGYEVVNIDSSGAAGGIDDPGWNGLDLHGSAMTPHTLNVTGSTNLDLEGNSLSLDHLRTFNATALGAALYAEFEGGMLDDEDEPFDVSLMGAQGDTEFEIDDTTANLMIETFGGDDIIDVWTHEGNISVDAGEGDNRVELDRVSAVGVLAEGNVSVDVTVGDGENTIEIDDVEGDGDGGESGAGNVSINVTAGDGDNNVVIEDVDATSDDNEGSVVVNVTVGDGDNSVEVHDIYGDGAGQADVSVTAGNGENTIIVDDIDGDASITAGDGGNDIEATDIDGDISVVAGDGDDRLLLDASRFATDVEGLGVSINLGGGHNTLALQGFFDELVSFDDADIQGDIQTLVAATSIYMPDGGSLDAVADVGGLDGLENIVFEGSVFVGTDNSFTIADAPDALNITLEEGAKIDGTFIIEDVEELTVNVGEEGSGADFDMSEAEGFQATDLETVTINLIEDSTFSGPTVLEDPTTVDVNNLTTMMVNGGADSEFTMHFDDLQSQSITTINLSGMAGEANVDLFEVTSGAGFDPITVTMGAGSLQYGADGNSSDGRETFEFTQDFGTVTIDDFEVGLGSDDDRLDLSAFGVTGGGQLNFDEGDDSDDLVITSAADQFEGEIVLVGRYDDATDIAAQSIIYA